MVSTQSLARDSDKSEVRETAVRPSLRKSITRQVNDAWILEVASLILSTIALTAVICVLKRYDGQPLQTWPYTLQITTVVSYLAIICKSTLVMSITAALSQCKWNIYTRKGRPLKLADFQSLEAATRGPLGALKLLISPRRPDLAIAIAAVIIAAFAFEPFVQQAVNFPSRFSLTNLTATIPIAIYYDSMPLGEYEQVDQHMSAAINDGLVYTNLSTTPNSIAAKCPTTNCAFSSYATLSICSECVNITESVKKSCAPTPDGNETCIYQLPNGLSSSTGENQITYLNITGHLATDRLANVTQFAWNFSGIGFEDSGENLILSAFDCIIYPCMDILTADVVSGRLAETFLDSVLPTDVTIDYGVETELVFALPDQFNSTLGPEAPRAYGMWGSSQQAIASYLADTLNGTLSGDGTNTTLEGHNTNTVMAMYTNYGSNLSQAIDNIATSMGDRIRLSGGTVANGTASSLEPYVEVWWRWLLLPVALEVVTWIAFLAVVLVTAKRKVPVWKGSTLAIMTWSVDKEDILREAGALGLAGLQRNDEMDKVGDQLFATMAKDENGKWIGLKVADRTGTYSHAQGDEEAAITAVSPEPPKASSTDSKGSLSAVTHLARSATC